MAIILFCIMVSLLLISVLEETSLKNMDKAFSSIYNDRLVPATDLFQISEQVYTKRHAIEAYVEHYPDRESGFPFNQKLNYLNHKIDSLVKKYENTYLVEKEKVGLKHLKVVLTQIKSLEKRIIYSENLIFPAIKSAFNESSLRLAHLTKIQSNVGEALIKNAEKEILSSKSYSTLQFILPFQLVY